MKPNPILDLTNLISLLKPRSLTTICPTEDSIIQISRKKRKFKLYLHYRFDETSDISIDFDSNSVEEVVDTVSKMLKLFPGYVTVTNFTEPDHVKLMKFEPIKEV